MKKIQGIDKEIKKLKAHLTQLKLNVKTRSMGVLLNQEATIRKKMKVVQYLLNQLDCRDGSGPGGADQPDPAGGAGDLPLLCPAGGQHPGDLR